MQSPPQLTHQPTNTAAKIHSSIIFYNKNTANLPWPQRTVTGIRIQFPLTTSSSNYTAEILGASIASALPGKINTHIYTDALGLVNSFYKTLTNNQNTAITLCNQSNDSLSHTLCQCSHPLLSNLPGNNHFHPPLSQSLSPPSSRYCSIRLRHCCHCHPSK